MVIYIKLQSSLFQEQIFKNLKFLRICQNTPGILSDSDPGERKLETVANIRERTYTVFNLQSQFKGKLNCKFLRSPWWNSFHQFLLSENGLLCGSRFL